MAKVDLETVQKILKSNGVDVRLAAEILNQLRDVVAEDAVEREQRGRVGVVAFGNVEAHHQNRLRGEFDFETAFAAGVDAILTPATPSAAP